MSNSLNIIRNNLGLIIVILTIILTNLLTKSNNLFTYDVFGYYLYLPKFFTDWNLHFTNLEWAAKINETYQNSPTLYQFSYIDNQNYVIRYSIGMSILYMPFFLIAHIISLLFNYTPDGFTAPYQWSIFIESMIVTILGFILLQKLLNNYFSNIITQITLICIYFGTNMTVHFGMYGLNLMQHNYLFFLYATLMVLSEKYKNSLNQKYWYYSIGCCGLMALIRPVEIIALLIPLFWTPQNPVFKCFRAPTISNIIAPIYSFLILVIIGSIQFLYWKTETGHWLINSYDNAGEGLDFYTPHIFNYLFSFRKGWLIYTPLVILAIIGFIYLYRLNLRLFYTLISIFIASIYITSSWSVWWYSGSFSSRAALPSYSYLCLPFAALVYSSFLNNKFSILKFIIAIILFCLVSLNIFQSWQYHKGIIHPDRMTKAAYLKNFLSTKKDPSTDELLLIARNEKGIENLNMNKTLNRKIIGFEDMEYGIDPSFVKEPVYGGNYSQKIVGNGFSKNIWTPFNATTSHYYSYLRVSCFVLIPTTIDSIVNANLCAQMEHRGKVYFWRSLNFETLEMQRNTWQYIEFIYLTPEVRSKDDIFKAFLWNRESSEIFIDNLKVEAFY